MLTIRLRRVGKKRQPIFRIVVADNLAPIYGKYLEMLGTYNPKTKAVTLKKEEILVWLNQGAKPSNTVSKILQKENLKHKSIVVKIFRAISKKDLEAQKAQEEAEKAKLQAEKEAAKAAFEEKVEVEKSEKPSPEEKLQAAAEESIKERKEEGTEKTENIPAKEKLDEVEEKSTEKAEGKKS